MARLEPAMLELYTPDGATTPNKKFPFHVAPLFRQQIMSPVHRAMLLSRAIITHVRLITQAEPNVGRGGRVVQRRTFRSRGPWFKTICCRFKTWANLFTPLCSCLSEETLKAVGPFYLVSMPGEVKDPTQGVNV